MSARKRNKMFLGVFVLFLGLGFGYAVYQTSQGPRTPASVHPSPLPIHPGSSAEIAQTLPLPIPSPGVSPKGDRIEVSCKLARIVNDYTLELEIRSNSMHPGLRAHVFEGDVEGKLKEAKPITVVQLPTSGINTPAVFKGKDFLLTIKPVIAAPKEVFRPATLRAELQKKRVNEELMCKTY